MKNKHYDNKHVPAKYIQRFLGLNSAADMLELKLFPNIKEIAESMAMFYAVEKIMSWDNTIQRDKKINVVVSGDGVVPRTACLFNYMTKWNTWSIDPAMRERNYSNVKRLTVIKDKIENIHLLFTEPVIILMPHSHAPIKDTWNNIKSDKKWLIKMECCTRDRLPLEAYYYKDKHAITAANDIYIWNNYMKLKHDL